MKNIMVPCLAVLLMASCREAESTAPEPATANNNIPDNSVNQALTSYYDLAETLVRWDSAAERKQAADLAEKIRGIRMEDISDDSLLAKKAADLLVQAQAANESIIRDGDETGRRKSFDRLTQHLHGFLQVIRYKDKKLYLQECPMAFNDEIAAVWLTDKGKDSIRNPYMGLHHPKYRDGMLECGGNKSTIDFQTR